MRYFPIVSFLPFWGTGGWMFLVTGMRGVRGAQVLAAVASITLLVVPGLWSSPVALASDGDVTFTNKTTLDGLGNDRMYGVFAAGGTV